MTMLDVAGAALATHIYSPQAVRNPINWAATEVSRALRQGDAGLAAWILDDPGRMHGLQVGDAVLGRRELHQVPWSAVTSDLPHRQDVVLLDSGSGQWLDHLAEEVALRGAKVEILDPRKLHVREHDMQVGHARRALPDAVMPTWVTGSPETVTVMRDLARRGVHVVNSAEALAIGRDKNLMAQTWKGAGFTDVPTSTPFVRTLSELRTAGDALGWPVVVKVPRSAMGRGVAIARNQEELNRIARGPMGAMAARQGGLLVQEAINTAPRDVRFHAARDVVTGKLRPIGATDRVALGNDFRANGGVEGNTIRPIYDLSGADPALPRESIEAALRAGDAAKLDWYSADIGRRPDGSPVIFEVDNFAHPLEVNQPVPRAQQSFPRAADLLVHGDRSRFDGYELD